MPRIIHDIATGADQSVAIIQTAASGGKWGQPCHLSTVRMDNEHVSDLLTSQKVLGNPKFEVIESWKVDGASTGPRSKFGKTLEAMKDELADHVQPGVHIRSSDIASDDGLKAHLDRASCLQEARKLEERTASVVMSSPAQGRAPTKRAEQEAPSMAASDGNVIARPAQRARARL